MRSTQDGVYTVAQATQGRDLFAMACQSCHTPNVHAGPPFRSKWFGRSLGDLFEYLQESMPKADPGSLSDEEYLLAIAYLMRINGMPTGSTPLAADLKVLHRIRIDSVRPAPPTGNPGTHR
jgi:mono/diheme cytochrome c family protein